MVRGWLLVQIRWWCYGAVSGVVVLLQRERRGAVVLMVAAVTSASPSWWLPAMVGHGGG